MAKSNFYRDEKPMGCCTQMMRGLLIFINGIFTLASIAAIIVAAIMLAKKDESYLNFCRVCARFNYVTIVACGLLLFFSMLGLRALWKRNTCTLIVYGIYLGIFFLISLAIGIIIILIHEEKFDSDLRNAWIDGADDDPAELCNFETKVGCSGWDTLCNETTDVNGTIITVANKQCAPCMNDQALQLANITVTCQDKLHQEVDKYYKPLIIVTFVLVGLSLVSLIVVCNLRKEFQDYEEISQNMV